MVRLRSTLLFFIMTLLISCNNDIVQLETKNLSFKLNNKGEVSSLFCKTSSIDYLDVRESSPLLTIQVKGKEYLPTSASWDLENKLQLFFLEGQIKIDVSITIPGDYLVFKIVNVISNKQIDLIKWGPFHNTINEIVGECIGVVRNDNYALGLQALNSKTIGGAPSSEIDILHHQMKKVSSSLKSYPDSLGLLYRGTTADHSVFGSVLQAYCRNRVAPRKVSTIDEKAFSGWAYENLIVPPYNDGGITGSAIAIFGCPSSQASEHISEIEIKENLPHPEKNGVWLKMTPEASQSYVIYPFGENNIKRVLAFVKKLGFKYLYNGDPFKTWGHFKLNDSMFPSGVEGLKYCVSEASKANIYLGLHTLSNFISTSDDYISPFPDVRLASVGSTTLTRNINKEQSEIYIDSPMFFSQYKNNHLHTVLIGDELIRYESVSDTEPWRLINCQRGAWNTVASSHFKGESLSKLMDHGYKVFLANIELSQEIARKIADIVNETGINQISFDGLEGLWSTGLGQYGTSLFMKSWYDALDKENQNCINDASIPAHFNWHYFTRMNWGEPWYAGFRESQLEYRMMNQDFYRRNLMPSMLGWFKLQAKTSLEDVEWLLARSAAYDAGFALVTNDNSFKNGCIDLLIEKIKSWERARLSGGFPSSIKIEMETLENEYTLEEKSQNEWYLYPYNIERYQYENMIRQPGEPVVGNWEFNNIYHRQPLQFLIKAEEDVENMNLGIANYYNLEMDFILYKGQIIKYSGGSHLIIYDENWSKIKMLPVDKSKLYFPSGKSSLIFSCTSLNSENVSRLVQFEVKTVGTPVALKATREINSEW